MSRTPRSGRAPRCDGRHAESGSAHWLFKAFQRVRIGIDHFTGYRTGPCGRIAHATADWLALRDDRYASAKP